MKIVRRIAALLLAAALSAALLCPAALADEKAETPEITLSQTSAVMAAGDTLQLTARVSDGQDVTWQSLTTAVASVDETGLVTALSEGRVVIRATAADGSVFANCTINVSMAFPSYSLRVGEKVSLQSSLGGSVTWRSVDSSVASVNGSGVVTAQGFGRTHVIASNGRESEGFAITVGAHVGIDISSWNNEIDWDALKEQNIEFVMIRVGYGESDTDKRFVENIEGAIANDMPFGVYYYSYAKDTAKAGREAAYCLKQLEPYKEYLTLPVAYDLEEYDDLSGAQLVAIAETFCTAVQDAGLNAMVYANGNFFSKMDLSSLNDMGVDHWYAWYPTVPDLNSIHTIRGTSTDPVMWQYSSSCVVQGAQASGKTDINVLYMPEYLDFEAPVLQAAGTAAGAQLSWGGSTYAGSYTVYRRDAAGNVSQVGTYDGATHRCTDKEYLPGMGYFVTMTICDPIDGTAYDTYTSETVYPASASYDVRVSAGEGGSVSGGGSFVVGSTATVTAEAAEDYTFAGWYDAAGKKVSDSAVYTFTVTASVSLTARFEKDEETQPESVFTDVKPTDWYADAVAYAVENGLFAGTSPTTFAPNATMTRGMLVTVLYRQAGEPAVSNHNKFSDVSADIWYACPVTWAYNNGIVTGTGEKTFSPNEPVSREQLATILYRYTVAKGESAPLSGDLGAFTDAARISDWAEDGVTWAVGQRILQGKGESQLDPKGGATRAECATMLMRWLDQ